MDKQERSSSMVTQKAKHTHTLNPCGKKSCGYISSDEHQAELMFPLDLECLAYFLSAIGQSGNTHNAMALQAYPFPTSFLNFSVAYTHDIHTRHTHTTQIRLTFVVLFL